MSETKPRLAVGYHFYNDFDTYPIILNDVRKTYSGPLELATDYMVINISRDNIKTRMAVVDENVWPLPPIRPKVLVKEDQQSYGEFVNSGNVIYEDVLNDVWSDVNKKYGTNAEMPFKKK